MQLGAQLLLGEVRGQHERLPLLVAGVDDRVELLEDPLAGLLGAHVVDVEEVDRAQSVDQLVEGMLGVVVVGRAQHGEQPRQRVDRHGATGLHRRLGDEHRQGGLARAHVAAEEQPPPAVEVLVDALAELLGGLDRDRRRALDGEDRLALEGDVAVARGDASGERLGLAPRDALGPARAGARGAHRLVEEEAGAVTAPERARPAGAGRGRSGGVH